MPKILAMKPVHIPPSECPICGYRMDMATPAGDIKKPHPGSASVCCNCGEFLVFGDDLHLRLPTSEETADVESTPHMKQFLDAAKAAVVAYRVLHDNKK